MEIFKKYVYPVAVLVGSIIGVGIFSLPYVALKSGIWLMLGYFLALIFITVVVHLAFAEISLKTPDFKRFPGFANFHLGKWGGALALLCSVAGIFGVLLAYLIVGGEFLTSIFQPYFGGSILVYTLFYFTAASVLILLGIKIIARFEFWALIFLLFSFLLIFIFGFSKFNFNNLFVSDSGFRASNFFLPYGAILFALWGTGMIPEVEEMLRGPSAGSGQGKKLFRKTIIISTLIPAAIYVLFTFLILGITGSRTTESALAGLKNFLPAGFFPVVLFAGVVTTFTAFITQGLTLKKVLMYDVGVKKWQAFIIACFTPLILFLMGLKYFLPLISFLGAVLVGVSGILILLIYKKVGGKNYIIYPLCIIFLLGIIYGFIYFL